MSNIANIFIESAERYPDHVAIVANDERITYADLAKEVKRTALHLQELGLQKGDRVLVFVPMSVDLYRIVLAIFYMGGTAVFLDEWVNKKRLALCCEIADCRGFVGIPKVRFYAFFLKAIRAIPIKFGVKKKGVKELERSLEMGEEETALITFTTGSTGTPKAAKRTHGFLMEQFNALLDEIDPASNDVDMPVLPIVLLSNLGVGSTSIIADFKSSKPEEMNSALIANQLADNAANRITASPFFVKKLAQHLLDSGRRLEGIQKVFTGGAPVFPDEAALYQQAFTSAQIKIVYGSTESEPISSILASELVNCDVQSDGGLCVGRIYEKASVKIVEISDEVITLSAPGISSIEKQEGSIGEIIVSGPHVLKEYFNNEEAFRRNKILDGETVWHRTGDAGFVKDGKLYLLGRCKQLILRDGSTISPFLVEHELTKVAGLTLGTVIEKNGEVLLVTEGKATAAISIPGLSYDRVVSLRKIPRDPRHNSKIDYDGLLGML